MKTLAIDFDGVLHLYSKGWKGPGVVDDVPVKGAMAWLYDVHERYDIQIYSSRSRYIRGRRAMQKWLKHHLEKELGARWYNVYRTIRWPWMKPAAFITLDDRAICFNGEFPSSQEIDRFLPWNKKPIANPHNNG